MKNTLILLIFCTLGVSCSKKIPKCSCEAVCKTFPVSWNLGGLISANQVHNPVYNPNNSNEFIYYSRENLNTNNSKFDLKLFNISTKEKSTLLENINIMLLPSWSKTGTIGVNFSAQSGASAIGLFYPNNGTFEIIHSVNPSTPVVWNSTGENLMWIMRLSDEKRYMLSYNAINGTLDTLFGQNEVGYLYPFHKKTVSENNVLAYESLYPTRIRLININSLHDTLLSEHDYIFDDEINSGNIVSMDWSKNNTTLYMYINLKNFGLMELNPITGAMSCILPYCCYESIETVATSPDGQNLLLEFNTRRTEEGAIIHSSSIELFNLASKSRTKLL